MIKKLFLIALVFLMSSCAHVRDAIRNEMSTNLYMATGRSYDDKWKPPANLCKRFERNGWSQDGCKLKGK